MSEDKSKQAPARKKRAEPAWVLFFEQQEHLDDACADGDMTCMPVELFGQRFFAYRTNEPTKRKEK